MILNFEMIEIEFLDIKICNKNYEKNKVNEKQNQVIISIVVCRCNEHTGTTAGHAAHG